MDSEQWVLTVSSRSSHINTLIFVEKLFGSLILCRFSFPFLYHHQMLKVCVCFPLCFDFVECFGLNKL